MVAADANAGHGHELCPRCHEIMVEAYCKVTCVNCGFMRDCNDQW